MSASACTACGHEPHQVEIARLRRALELWKKHMTTTRMPYALRRIVRRCVKETEAVMGGEVTTRGADA